VTITWFGHSAYAKLANIGIARLQQSRFDEAAVLLKEALQLSPTFESVNVTLIACYGHLGRG